MNAYMKNVKCLPAAELYKHKNISLSLHIALSPSHLALSACLKLPYVIFIILLFLFFFFFSFFTFEAYWVTRWKDLPRVTLYLFIESERAEKSRANWVYEISGMTCGKMKKENNETTDDTRLVEKTGDIRSLSFSLKNHWKWWGDNQNSANSQNAVQEVGSCGIRSISSDDTDSPGHKDVDGYHMH